jgi:hypothetical protein
VVMSTGEGKPKEIDERTTVYAYPPPAFVIVFFLLVFSFCQWSGAQKFRTYDSLLFNYIYLLSLSLLRQSSKQFFFYSLPGTNVPSIKTTN